jgi:hypothetical protein
MRPIPLDGTTTTCREGFSGGFQEGLTVAVWVKRLPDAKLEHDHFAEPTFGILRVGRVQEQGSLLD